MESLKQHLQDVDADIFSRSQSSMQDVLWTVISK